MAEFMLGQTPFLLYPATQKQAVIVNHDDENDIIVGPEEGIYSFQPSGAEGGQITDPNVTVISSAGGQMVVDGSWAVYGLALQGADPTETTAAVSVTEGATALLPGANETATALINSGFITEMAIAFQQALSQGTISLLANPTPLYQTPPVVATSTAALGSNIRANTPGYGSSLGSNIAAWELVTSEPLNCRRIETPGVTINPDIPTIFGPDITAGRLVIVSFSPSFNAGPNPSTQMVSDNNTLSNTLKNMKAAGVNARIILFHEPTNGGLSPAQFIFSIQYYSPTVRQFYPLDFGWSVNPSSDPKLASYTTGLFTANVFDGAMGDFYCHEYIKLGVLTGSSMSNIAALADNNMVNGVLTPLPLGMGEIGWNPGLSDENAADIVAYYQYLAGNPAGNSNGFFPGRVAAGKINSYLCWFNPTGLNVPGDISSVILSGGSQITGYQWIFNGVDTTATSSNLPSGSTITPTPINPSPVGGLATANQESYDLALDLIAGAGSTKPFCRVTITFFDFDATTANQVPVDEVKFIAPMGTSPNPAKTICTGPMSGAYMSVQLRNLDSVNATLNKFQLEGSARTKALHNPRWDSLTTPQAIPTYSLPTSGIPYSRMLGSWVSPSITSGGGTQSALFSMNGGNTYLKFGVTGTAAGSVATVRLQLIAQPTSEWGAVPLHTAWLPLSTGSAPSQFEDSEFVDLPLGPCVVLVTNEDPNAVVASVVLISEDD